MSSKIGRNDPCPCKSGKKYKKCCIDKQDDNDFLKIENFHESYKEVRKKSKIKQCLHPDQNNCSEKIINAHSIQNNKILKKIASNGKVVMPCPKPDNPFAVMTEYGRKEASVFTGFCGHHDTTVFSAIENNNFDGSEYHIFLYIYRSFAIEYHKKQESVNMGLELLKKKPSLMNKLDEDYSFRGFEVAVDDLSPVKRIFDKALLSKKYNILNSIVWELNGTCKFAASGYEAPTYDLDGNKIQDLTNPKLKVKHIFVSVFPEEDKTFFIISCLSENYDFFKSYFDKLEKLTVDQKKNYINNILPIISENIAINPESWENWDESQKNEFGSLLWGFDTLAILNDIHVDRLQKPTFDLFEL